MGVKRVFAVDLGASGGKCFAGVFENGTFSMDEIHRFDHGCVSFYVADKSGTVAERMHWDDTLLYQNIIEGLRAYRRDVAETVDSVGIDTWGSDGVFLTEDGDMLGKMYAYRDHRLDDMMDVVRSRIDAARIYEITGIHFQPFNISNQLCWFMMNRADMLRPGCFFLPVPSLFHHYLGGVKEIDSSWASITQLMDAKAKVWSKEILDKLGIPLEVMPPIVEPGTVLGELLEPLAESLSLNRAKLIAVGTHDTASAFAAAPVDNVDDSLIISSGTWSLIGKLIPEPITSAEAMAANISNEGGIGNIRFLRNCMGTWIVQELRRGWQIADGREMDWEELNRLTEAAPPFSVFIDPDDAGFYNPASMEDAMAEFCKRTGQTMPADRGAVLRTVYESLALKYRMVNEMICNACGKGTSTVNIVGGGCRNTLLNQFTANSLGLPVVAGPEEATAVGNIMVQALGLDILRSMEAALPIIRGSFPIKDYAPQDTASWNEAYETFTTVVQQ